MLGHLYGRHTNLVHIFYTSLSHIRRFCSPTVACDWFPVILLSIVMGDTCEAGNGHYFQIHSLCGVYDFTQHKDNLRINDTGFFPWISLTSLSRTYFIIFPFMYHCKWVFLLSFLFQMENKLNCKSQNIHMVLNAENQYIH